MPNPMLFCNTGWMVHYKGISDTDKIIGGGKYVKLNNDGGEVYNFYNRDGHYYGYVQPVNVTNRVTGGTIHVEKLGAPKKAMSISGVDVILTAKRPKGRTVVVG